MAAAPQPSFIDRLWIAQTGLCFHCGEPMVLDQNDSLQNSREHLYPQSRRGKGTNKIVLAHRACNSARGNPDPTEDELDRADAIYIAIGEHGFRPLPVPVRAPLASMADIWPTLIAP